MIMIKIAAVVPAYNEEEAITQVVQSLYALEKEGIQLQVVVVNDCSRDKTVEVVECIGVSYDIQQPILLDLPVNLGIGGAVQTGFRYAFENGFDYAVQVDGDGQHPAQEIPKLLEALQTTNANVAIGSRFIRKEGFQSTGMRRMGINYLKNLIRLLTGVSILDNTSGFRMLDRKALALVNEYYPDEYPEPESIIMYVKNKIDIVEVPVSMNERQGGVSSIRYFDQLYYMVKVSLALVYSYIRNK
jgi:glycosyltransferase involved in cell wall biosynthesis